MASSTAVHPGSAAIDLNAQRVRLLLSQPGPVTCYHLRTLWLFVRSDIFNLPVVGVLVGAAYASLDPPAIPPREILSSLPPMAAWSLAHLLLFNLHNQLRGRAEDALNKPWRPIPAGRISQEQTALAVCAAYPLAAGVAAGVGGLGVSLLGLAMCVWYNELGGGDDPWLKSMLNGVGICCFLAGPLEVVLGRSVFAGGDGSGSLGAWMLVVLCAVGATNHTQDFRDTEGDGEAGRRTIPLALGDGNARALVVLGVAGFTGFSCCFWETGYKASAFCCVAAVMLAGNLCLNRCQRGDDFSWKKLWFLWFMGLLFLPFFKVYL